MKNKDETHEEQVMRCLKEMVEDGQVLMEHGEDGELYFSLAEPVVEPVEPYEL